jgi:hypothetical protein
VDDEPAQELGIDRNTTIRLGNESPTVSFEVEIPNPAPGPSFGTETAVKRYIDRYFRYPATGSDIGAHTFLVRKAFARVPAKQLRTYWILIVTLAILASALGGVRNEARRQTQAAFSTR